MPSPQRPRRLVGVSLKLYFDLQQTHQYIQACTSLSSLTATHNIDIFIIPDLLSLSTASALLSPTCLQLGAPDCFWEDHGPYTGEVSPAALRSLGVSIVELGHAERRRLFAETDAQVAAKAKGVERNGMTPLVCIGEMTKGDNIDKVLVECKAQMDPVLEATSGPLVFAYEPVWAIGQAESASAEYVVSVAKGLRAMCGGRDVRIIYGGSAGLGTFKDMKDGVDGLFLGRFAHNVGQFESIIKEIGSL